MSEKKKHCLTFSKNEPMSVSPLETGSFTGLHFQRDIFNEFNFLVHRKCDTSLQIITLLSGNGGGRCMLLVTYRR